MGERAEASSTTDLFDVAGQSLMSPPSAALTKEAALLICAQCHIDLRQQFKKSKLLPCLHPVCLDCYSQFYRQASQGTKPSICCPVCQVALGDYSSTTDNFLAPFLMDDSVRSSTQKICSSCTENNISTMRCIDCDDYLCESCVAAHERVKITKDHRLEKLAEPYYMWLDQRELKCPWHPRELLQIFCEKCTHLTCKDCQLTQHKDHKYQLVKDIEPERRSQLEHYRIQNSNKLSHLSRCNELATKRHNEVTQREAELKKEIGAMISLISHTAVERGRELIKQLETVCSEKRIAYENYGSTTAKAANLHRQAKFATEAALASGKDAIIVYSQQIISRQMTQVIGSCAIDVNELQAPLNIGLTSTQNLNAILDALRRLANVGQVAIPGQARMSHNVSAPPTSTKIQGLPSTSQTANYPPPNVNLLPGGTSVYRGNVQVIPRSQMLPPPLSATSSCRTQLPVPPPYSTAQKMQQQNQQTRHQALQSQIQQQQQLGMYLAGAASVQQPAHGRTHAAQMQSLPQQLATTQGSSGHVHPYASSPAQLQAQFYAAQLQQTISPPQQQQIYPPPLQSNPSRNTYPLLHQQLQQRSPQLSPQFATAEQLLNFSPPMQGAFGYPSIQPSTPVISNAYSMHVVSAAPRPDNNSGCDGVQQQNHVISGRSHENNGTTTGAMSSFLSASGSVGSTQANNTVSGKEEASQLLDDAHQFVTSKLDESNSATEVQLSSGKPQGNTAVVSDSQASRHSALSSLESGSIPMAACSNIAASKTTLFSVVDLVTPEEQRSPPDISVARNLSAEQMSVNDAAQKSQQSQQLFSLKSDSSALVSSDQAVSEDQVVSSSNPAADPTSSADVVATDEGESFFKYLLEEVKKDSSNTSSSREASSSGKNNSTDSAATLPKLALRVENGTLVSELRTGDSWKQSSGKNIRSNNSGAAAADLSNWDDYCSVCQNGGDLLCCDGNTINGCRRVFHKNCHVPDITDESETWLCGFCENIANLKNGVDLAFEGEIRPKTKMTAYELRLCQRILLQLYCHCDSQPFHEPISDLELLHDYSKVIRYPMDFSTIRRKLSNTNSKKCPLNEEGYDGFEDFVADLNLVFQNCAKFNAHDSEVGIAGHLVAEEYKELIDRFKPAYSSLVRIDAAHAQTKRRHAHDGGSATKKRFRRLRLTELEDGRSSSSSNRSNEAPERGDATSLFN